MNASALDDIRARQATLRTEYRDSPERALTPLAAHGESTDAEPAFTVTQWSGPARTGLHRATGGSGDDACSGNILLEAVLACAGVTLRSAAAAAGVTVRSVVGDASATFDARGTLGLDRTVPIGVQDLAIEFALDADLTDEQLERLGRTVERYCVVGQSLANPPTVTIRRANPQPS